MTESTPDPRVYRMRISRLTIDKLGVKLYDRASAVVAELIANSHDADASRVVVRLPLGTQLNKPPDANAYRESGWEIVVEDDGHGMTPGEADEHYLKVGRDRRAIGAQGAKSRELNRPVMGRKGIGKLAPFGICRQIEVVSAGGENTGRGFLVSHFIMNYDDIIRDEEGDAHLETGRSDGTYSANSGTKVILRHFISKRVPNEEIFHRQVARRFRQTTNFEILLEDTRANAGEIQALRPFDVPVVPDTRINLSERPVRYGDGTELPVVGYVGMAKESYRDEEEAGVRIYARNKIVATTHDFGQPAGFTGEFTARSYLVGEIHAEWLDEDDGDDLIRTDRQGILWDSEYGQALRDYGKALVREVAARSREPRRQRVHQIFLERSGIETIARDRFKEEAVVDTVLLLAKQIGSLAAEDELEDDVYVLDLTEVILAVAPHKALIDAFREFANQTARSEVDDLTRLADLFGRSRIAELASYAQIATERVTTIQKLEQTIDAVDVSEAELQEIVASAPWLVKPDWSLLTANQWLKTFKTRFESWWKSKHGKEITLAISYEQRRPDLTLVSVDNRIHIVELKVRNHAFNNGDFDRLHGYIEALLQFETTNPEIMRPFGSGWDIHLIADSVSIGDSKNRALFDSYVESGRVIWISWNDFFARAVAAHQELLDIRESFDQRQASQPERIEQ